MPFGNWRFYCQAALEDQNLTVEPAPMDRYGDNVLESNDGDGSGFVSHRMRRKQGSEQDCISVSRHMSAIGGFKSSKLPPDSSSVLQACVLIVRNFVAYQLAPTVSAGHLKGEQSLCLDLLSLLEMFLRRGSPTGPRFPIRLCN
jgi:hypothetical protein